MPPPKTDPDDVGTIPLPTIEITTVDPTVQSEIGLRFHGLPPNAEFSFRLVNPNGDLSPRVDLTADSEGWVFKRLPPLLLAGEWTLVVGWPIGGVSVLTFDVAPGDPFED